MTTLNTPWGIAEYTDTIPVNGGKILFVSTPSHGGYLVPLKLAARMPASLRAIGESFGDYLAFEEDCNAAAVALSFPEMVSDPAMLMDARLNLQAVYPQLKF